MKIEAVVFDIDGTMIDTGNLWIQSALEVNEKYGMNYTLDEIKSYIGTGKKDEYCNMIKEFFNEKIDSGKLKTKAGLQELLIFLQKNKIKIAVATSSKLEKVKRRFASAKIDISIFDCIVSGEMVTNNKPNPEIYLLAAKLLGVKPENAIAVEDSDKGIQSAVNAGFFTVLIPDVCEPNYKTVEIADKVYSSLDLLKEFIKWNLK